MDQTETLALYARAEAARAEAKAAGQDDDAAHAAATAVWNGWAEGMLAKRKELEAAGTWVVTKDVWGTLEGQNGATRAWFNAAKAIFSTLHSRHKFEHPVDCRSWIFPGTAWFDQAIFAGHATFTSHQWFARGKFEGAAWFDGATFVGAAWFNGATFTGTVRFERASFLSYVRFDKSTFMGEAGFESAIFKVNAGFDRATFMRVAMFNGALFSGTAWFNMATFVRDANFALVKFDGYATFARTRFRQKTTFNAINCGSAFSLEEARFRQVPDFIQANFLQAPRLDNVIVRPTLLLPSDVSIQKQSRLSWARYAAFGNLNRLIRGDSTVPACYRALKRLAIQGHDLEREQMFHAGEIRSARFATDWPMHWKLYSKEGWTSIWRFWFGLVYEILSDFGRSVMRPAIAWALLLVFSAAIYLGANPDVARERAKLVTDAGTTTLVVAYAETTLAAWHRNQPCVANGPGVQGLPDAVRNVTSAIGEALHLSFANGAVLGDVGSPDTGTRTYGCLYGLAPVSGDARLSIVPYPGIVATMSKIQRFLSALLIFLFGLAVRNMLKMK